MTAQDLIAELDKYAVAKDGIFLQRFFKTGSGQYGEGDQFIGVRMPNLRIVCKQFKDLSKNELEKLVNSPVHEHRMSALVIVSNRYKKSTPKQQQELYDFYMSALNRGKVNNWDLIDVTCPNVVGKHLKDKPRKILYKLAVSESLWERRASILATFAFIQNGEADDALTIAEILLYDKEDLIHKASGWMLREVGKRIDQQILCRFLDHHAHQMPRTMLRYSIEKLSPTQKQKYMNAK